MQRFACGNCGHGLYFHNTTCLKCGHRAGFSPDAMQVVALAETDGGGFVDVGKTNGKIYAFCKNGDEGVCNWLVPHDAPQRLCKACAHNRMIPNLAVPANLPAWYELERAKKHLIYTLMRLRLPLDGAAVGRGRMVFDFVEQAGITHFDGVITIDVAEVDPVERERQRQILDEPYRSILGHLRHESGHFYWMLLIDAGGPVDRFRSLFGDERSDYLLALAQHRAEGPPADWQDRHVSAYASSHPWEDWAETWAHYLHIVEGLDTAEAQGIAPLTGTRAGSGYVRSPYEAIDFQSVVEDWIDLSVAINEMSRSIGHPDYYPFVLTPTSIEKLCFVHEAVKLLRARLPKTGVAAKPGASAPQPPVPSQTMR